MTPWTIDANDLWKNKDEPIEALVRYISEIQNEEVKTFLKPSVGYKTILVGEKGMGKSLLLATKSFVLRTSTKEKKQAYTFFPDDFTERLQGGAELRYSIQENPAMWRDVDNWRDVWCIALEATALECTNLVNGLSNSELKRFREFFDPMYQPKDGMRGPKQYTIVDYLIQVVKNWTSDEERSKLLSLQRQIIRRELRTYQTPICFFVDSPDEALDSKDQPINVGDYVPWVCLQLGLLYAVRAIAEFKDNFYIYAALRSEIYNFAKTADPAQPLFQQASAKCLILKYHQTELERIFAFNCKHDEIHWTCKDLSDPIANFLGAEQVAHTRVKNGHTTPINETSFMTLLRHTLYRPRDLMVFGNAISAIPLEERSEANIRQKINDTTSELFNFYTQQVAPQWEDLCTQALHYVDSNVISQATVKEILEKLKKENPGHKDFSAFQYLYSHGMLGTINTSQNKQFFVTDPEKRGDTKATLPTSEWYFLHPILDHLIERDHGENYKKSKDIVVGYHCSAVMPPVIKVTKTKEDACIQIEYHSKPLFPSSNSLTKPIQLLLIFAQAVKTTGKSMLSHADLSEAVQKLAEDGWFENVHTANSIVLAQFTGKSPPTDNTTPINNAITAADPKIMQAIRKKKNMPLYEWTACKGDQINFQIQ